MFFGSIPALVTPFSGGRVAEDTFSALVEWQIAEGSSALVPCGTTGEVATLSHDEHREVIAHAVRVAAGRVPVIAGCGKLFHVRGARHDPGGCRRRCRSGARRRAVLQ